MRATAVRFALASTSDSLIVRPASANPVYGGVSCDFPEHAGAISQFHRRVYGRSTADPENHPDG